MRRDSLPFTALPFAALYIEPLGGELLVPVPIAAPEPADQAAALPVPTACAAASCNDDGAPCVGGIM